MRISFMTRSFNLFLFVIFIRKPQENREEWPAKYTEEAIYRGWTWLLDEVYRQKKLFQKKLKKTKHDV